MRIALSLLLMALPLAAAKKPTTAQLKAQVKQLTQERDDLQQRLDATKDLQTEIASAKKARDLARSEAEAAHKEAEELKTSLKENQGGSDTILKELKEAKQSARQSRWKPDKPYRKAITLEANSARNGRAHRSRH